MFPQIQPGPAAMSGFTMIELIMVIVILGILSAVALPRFIDLRSDARHGAMMRMGANLGSASAMNHARCQITANVADGVKCVTVNNCTDMTNLLQGGLPATLQGEGGSALYIVPQAISGTVNGTVVDCTLRLDDASGTLIEAVTFRGIATGF